MATCEIWLPVRYGYLRDIASDAILLTCDIWLPRIYCYLRDIRLQYVSYNRIPISCDRTYPTILTADVIWLFICRRLVV